MMTRFDAGQLHSIKFSVRFVLFLLDDFSTTLKLGACRVKMGKRRRNIIYTKYRSKKRNRSEGDGRDGEKESGVSDAT